MFPNNLSNNLSNKYMPMPQVIALIITSKIPLDVKCPLINKLSQLISIPYKMLENIKLIFNFLFMVNLKK